MTNASLSCYWRPSVGAERWFEWSRNATYYMQFRFRDQQPLRMTTTTSTVVKRRRRIFLTTVPCEFQVWVTEFINGQTIFASDSAQFCLFPSTGDPTRKHALTITGKSTLSCINAPRLSSSLYTPLAGGTGHNFLNSLNDQFYCHQTARRRSILITCTETSNTKMSF